MPHSWRFARVTYIPSYAEILAARVIGWAAMGDPVSMGPGMSQSDAVQYVTDLVVLRHVAAVGVLKSKFAWYSRGTNKFLGTTWNSTQNADSSYPVNPRYKGSSYAVPMVGDEPIQSYPGPTAYALGGIDTDTWNRKLVLALDDTIRRIAKAEQAGEIVPGWGAEMPGGARPELGAIGAGAVAIIVAGAAVAIVGSFAAWRYFSPEVRIQAAAVRTAAKAYENRLRVIAETGVSLPPGPLELASASEVDKAAKGAANRYIGYGTAALAGGALGISGVSYIRNRMTL